jgi:hypothetical protein
MGSRSKGPLKRPETFDRRLKTGREFNPLPRPPKFLVCPCHRASQRRR